MKTENKYSHISSKTKLTKKAGKLPYMCFQKAGHTFIKKSKNADKCKHVIAKKKIMEICKLSGSMLYGN